MSTRVMTVTCPHCKSEIYSRAQHDYRGCYCGKTTVDGGFDYLRYGWSEGPKPVVRTRYIRATRTQLYDDWNKNEYQYGVICGTR